MKIESLFVGTVFSILATINLFAQTTQHRQTTNLSGDVALQTKPSNSVWTIDFIKTNQGQQADFLKFIEQNWAKARQILKFKGEIASYQVLSLPPSQAAEWDVLLLTEYVNQTAHNQREQLFAEVFKTQPTTLINGVDGRNMREIKFSRVFTQPISSETAQAMLAAQTSNPEVAAARVPLENYLKGHETGNADFIRRAFHRDAKIMSFRDGKLNQLTVEEFAERFNGKSAPDEQQRKRRIETVEITGNAAVSRIVLDYPTVKFTDYMSLLKIGDEWKIVNKAFYAEPKPSAANK